MPRTIAWLALAAVALSGCASSSSSSSRDDAPTPPPAEPRSNLTAYDEPSATSRTRAPTTPSPHAPQTPARTPTALTREQKEEWPEPQKAPPSSPSSTTSSNAASRASGEDVVPPPPPDAPSEPPKDGADAGRAWNGHAWVALAGKHAHGPGCGHFRRDGRWCFFAEEPRPAPRDVRRDELLDPTRPFYLHGGRAWALVGHVHGEGCGHVRRADGYHIDPELGGDAPPQ